MILTRRRDFLRLCIGSASALAFAHRVFDDSIIRATAHGTYRTPGSLERYIDPLPIPMRLMPQSGGADGVQYRIRMLEFTQQMHSQLAPLRINLSRPRV